MGESGIDIGGALSEGVDRAWTEVTDVRELAEEVCIDAEPEYELR